MNIYKSEVEMLLAECKEWNKVCEQHLRYIEKLKKQLKQAPPQRTWVGLDPEEIRKTNHHMVDGAYHYSFKQGAEWAEAKLKEKNT